MLGDLPHRCKPAARARKDLWPSPPAVEVLFLNDLESHREIVVFTSEILPCFGMSSG